MENERLTDKQLSTLQVALHRELMRSETLKRRDDTPVLVHLELDIFEDLVQGIDELRYLRVENADLERRLHPVCDPEWEQMLHDFYMSYDDEDGD